MMKLKVTRSPIELYAAANGVCKSKKKEGLNKYRLIS
jgi:hypothetical protein